MDKPYKRDLELLQAELGHYEYFAKKFTQECDPVHAKEFREVCTEIKGAIEAVKKRQDAALAEWAALSLSKRRAVLLPLIAALEETVSTAKMKGCPEFAAYLDSYMSGYLIDLQDFRE